MSTLTATDIWLSFSTSEDSAWQCSDCEHGCVSAYVVGHWESHGALGSEPVDDALLCPSCVRQRAVQWALLTTDDALDRGPFERIRRMD